MDMNPDVFVRFQLHVVLQNLSYRTRSRLRDPDRVRLAAPLRRRRRSFSSGTLT